MSVRLILQADDFGRNSETTGAILACVDRGTITSVTLMTNMPGTEQALQAARRFGTRTSVGVHVNLCEGHPLTAAPTLVSRDGRFLPRRTLVRKALAGRLDAASVAAEVSAQIARARSAGIKISHLDSHKHVHLVAPICHIVADAARRFGIGRVRCPSRPLWRGVPASAWAMVISRTLASRRARTYFRMAGLTSPERFVDLRQLTMRTAAVAPEQMRRLAALRDGSRIEVMCHPAGNGSTGSEPMNDATVLLSEAFPRALAAARVETCTYWDC